MKATLLYRIASVLFILFAAGHTFGFLSFKPASPEGLAVRDAMNNVHFQGLSYRSRFRRNFPWSLLLVLFLLGCNSSQPTPPQPSSQAQVAPVAIDPATAGSVVGLITLKGTPPKMPSLDMTQDPGCPP